MKVLAIEQSTAVGSIALLEGSRLLAQESWTESRGRAGRLFEMLPPTLEAASWTTADVDLFAAGLGPGSFSGLRTSLSAANHLALPGGKPVIGIPSAQAVAYQVMRERGVDTVTIVGDARRKRLWHACFRGSPESMELEKPFALLGVDELATAVSDSGVLVSPDWDRIDDVLLAASGGLEVIREARIPGAAAVARLAAGAFDPAHPPRPPEPIYMHPPVFVEPRFPADRPDLDA